MIWQVAGPAVYTECYRWNLPRAGRTFLRLNYSDITKMCISKVEGLGDKEEKILKSDEC